MTVRRDSTSFTSDVLTFAAERKEVLLRYEEKLRPHVADALRRLGLSQWQAPIIAAALDVFDEAARFEIDEWNPIIDDMRDAFAEELSETLAKTGQYKDEAFDTEVEKLTRWLATAAVNAGTEAAVVSDPDETVGLEWVTMEDDRVRDTHKEAAGQVVPSGQPFSVGDAKLLYPGQPVGDPANWINCRCQARPTALTDPITAAANAPGLKEDGTPPVCKYCDQPATQYVLHSEGMAYVPACDAHIEQAKTDAAKSTPDGTEDPSNIVRVAPYALTAAPVEEEEPVAEEPPMIPDEEAALLVPFHGVAAPEGKPSGDRRQFAIGAITHRELPLPLTAMFSTDREHKGAKVGAGRIDKIWKDDQNLIWYEGVFDMSETGYETLRLVAEEMWRGVSVDLDDGEGGVTMADDGKEAMEITKGRICAITCCAIPAFPEAFIALGPYDPALYAEADEESVGIPTEQAASLTEGGTFEVVPPKTKDGPGWITHPDPTKDITSYWVKGPGAAKIAWGTPGDFNRCRVQLAKYVQNPDWLAGLCANLHYRALGNWPGRSAHSGGSVSMAITPDAKGQQTAFSLTASATSVLPMHESRFFKNPELTKPTPLTVDDDGRVYGHIASFDSCHIAEPEGEGICTKPPRSLTNYAHFLTGHVNTEVGRIPVGQITLGGKHAPKNLSLRAATQHYDDTTKAVADVHVGEDEFGTWFSGKIRSTATPEQVHELAASGKVSGDWRGQIVGGAPSLELIAALAVNVAGFQTPRTEFAMEDGMQMSLVASGIVDGDKPELSPDEQRAERVNAVKATLRGVRAANLKNTIKSLKGE